MATRLVRPALIALSISALTACVTQPDQPLATRSTTTAAYVEGVPGGTITRHTVMLATITAIDPAHGTLTLVDAQQDEREVSVDTATTDLSALSPGDKIKISLIEEQLILVKEAGSEEVTRLAAVSDIDGKTSSALLDLSRQRTAEVRAVDQANHTATLLFSDGSIRTIAVRPDVPLSESSLGKIVVIQTSQALAISISKP